MFTELSDLYSSLGRFRFIQCGFNFETFESTIVRRPKAPRSMQKFSDLLAFVGVLSSCTVVRAYESSGPKKFVPQIGMDPRTGRQWR
jgi:hypothetical protein